MSAGSSPTRSQTSGRTFRSNSTSRTRVRAAWKRKMVRAKTAQAKRRNTPMTLRLRSCHQLAWQRVRQAQGSKRGTKSLERKKSSMEAVKGGSEVQEDSQASQVGRLRGSSSSRELPHCQLHGNDFRSARPRRTNKTVRLQTWVCYLLLANAGGQDCCWGIFKPQSVHCSWPIASRTSKLALRYNIMQLPAHLWHPRTLNRASSGACVEALALPCASATVFLACMGESMDNRKKREKEGQQHQGIREFHLSQNAGQVKYGELRQARPTATLLPMLHLQAGSAVYGGGCRCAASAPHLPASLSPRPLYSFLALPWFASVGFCASIGQCLCFCLCFQAPFLP